MRPTADPRPGARSLTITVDGRAWRVADLEALLEDYASRIGWLWLRGCEKCASVCTNVVVCPCCAGENAPADAMHVRIMRMELFVDRFQPAQKAS